MGVIGYGRFVFELLFTFGFVLFYAAMKLSWHWTRKNIVLMDQSITICLTLSCTACLFSIFIGGCWCIECLWNKFKQEASSVMMSGLVSYFLVSSFSFRMWIFNKELNTWMGFWKDLLLRHELPVKNLPGPHMSMIDPFQICRSGNRDTLNIDPLKQEKDLWTVFPANWLAKTLLILLVCWIIYSATSPCRSSTFFSSTEFLSFNMIINEFQFH